MPFIVLALHWYKSRTSIGDLRFFAALLEEVRALDLGGWNCAQRHINMLF